MKLVAGFLSAALVAASATPAMAQAGPTHLRILVEDLNSGSSLCGISDASLTATVRAALRYNRVQETTDLDFPLVYVNANTLNDNVGCVTALDLRILVYGQISALGVGTIFGQHVLCNSGGVLTGADHRARLSDYIKEHFDQCLSQIADQTR